MSQVLGQKCAVGRSLVGGIASRGAKASLVKGGVGRVALLAGGSASTAGLEKRLGEALLGAARCLTAGGTETCDFGIGLGEC